MAIGATEALHRLRCVLPRTVQITVPFLLALVSVILLARWLRAAPLNADEGFYLASACASLDGRLPYLDYGYTQMPLLPLLNAPLVAVLGPTLEGLRTVSALWAGLSLSIAFLLMRGRERPLGAGLGIGLLLSCPSLLSFLVTGKTYAAGQTLLLLAAASFTLPVSARLRLLWLSLFSVLAVGTRSTFAPAAALLWLGFALLHRRECGWRSLLLAPAVSAALLLGPFILADPQSFWFWNWTFHRAADRPLHSTGLMVELWLLSPALCLGALAAPFLAWLGWRRDPAGAIIILSALAAILVNLAYFGNYAEYAVPYALLLFSGLSRLLSSEGPLMPPALRWLLPLGLLGANLLVYSPPAKETCDPLSSSLRASAFLRSHTQGDDEVLASMPEIPLGAGRPLLFELVMGKFGVTDELPAERAARLHMATFRELQWAVASRHAKAVVLTRYPRWNFIWTLPSYNSAALSHQRFLWHLGANYEKAYEDGMYLIFLPRPTPLFSPPADILRL